MFETDVGRLGKALQRVKTLRNKIENSGIIKIIPKGIVERLLQPAILRVLICWLEVRGCESNDGVSEGVQVSDADQARLTRRNHGKRGGLSSV